MGERLRTGVNVGVINITGKDVGIEVEGEGKVLLGDGMEVNVGKAEGIRVEVGIGVGVGVGIGKAVGVESGVASSSS